MRHRDLQSVIRNWTPIDSLTTHVYGTHSIPRTKATLIYRQTGNLRAVQLLLGHTKIESTVRYLGIAVDDAIAEQIDIWQFEHSAHKIGIKPLEEGLTVPTDLVNVPSGDLMKVDEASGAGFRAMRKALVASGPLSNEVCELIVISSFAAVGYERSFKIHALRARQSGISKAALQHAVMITLGATTALLTVTNALGWLDEVCEEFSEQQSEKPAHPSVSPQ